MKTSVIKTILKTLAVNFLFLLGPKTNASTRKEAIDETIIVLNFLSSGLTTRIFLFHSVQLLHSTGVPAQLFLTKQNSPSLNGYFKLIIII